MSGKTEDKRGGGRSLFSKVTEGIVSTFVEVTPDEHPAPKGAPPTPHAPPSAPGAPSVYPQTSRPMPAAAPATEPEPLDPKVFGHIEGRMNAAKPPPYVSFMRQYDLLAAEFTSPAEEPRHLRMALRASETSADAILAAIDALLNVASMIQQEAEDSHTNGRSQVKSDLDGKLATIDEKIHEHTTELQKLQVQRDTLTAEASEKEQRLTVRVRTFERGIEDVLGRLSAQKAAIAAMKGG